MQKSGGLFSRSGKSTTTKKATEPDDQSKSRVKKPAKSVKSTKSRKSGQSAKARAKGVCDHLVRDKLLEIALIGAGGVLGFAGVAEHFSLMTSYHLYVIGGLAVFGLGAAALRCRRLSPAAEEITRHQDHNPGTQTIARRLEDGVEALKDVQWELQDSQSRYRELLDNQIEVILRRDRDNKLTFVNSAFYRTFGGDREAIVGHKMQLKILQSELPEQVASLENADRLRYRQRIETLQGPRWFAWEEITVRDASGNVLEVQSVVRDISAQRAADEALAETRDQAEAANRAKSRFLAAMSHEIRTPMNGILGMTGLMMDTELTLEQQNYNRAVNKSAKTLLSLIDEILDFSKIEAGKLELVQAPFVLGEVVEGVTELLAPRAHEKGLSVSCYLAPDLPTTILGDEVRLRQILTNIIGNAIKFTNAGGIAVIVEPVSQADMADLPGEAGPQIPLRFTIEDTGIGMKENQISQIFAEFEQIDNSSARRAGGTGLGLAITKRLLEQMGSCIKVQSRPDEGSTFTFVLAARVEGQFECISDTWPAISGKQRVLIASDGETESRLLQRQLNGVGIQAVCVVPSEAVDMLWTGAQNGQAFNVVITDKLEDLKFAERLAHQAAHAAQAPVKAIALLEASDRTSFPTLKERGFGAYLTRPARALSLYRQINEAETFSPFASQNEDEMSDEEVAAQDERTALRQLASKRHSETQAGTKPVSTLSFANGDNCPRVLMAEDNEINALLGRKILEKCGCEVVHVVNGIEALEAVRDTLLNGGARPFDLILMDINMPEMDGLEATRNIRDLGGAGEKNAPAEIPMIALTASAFEETRDKCFDAGMNGYLAKPFEREELEDILKAYLQCSENPDQSKLRQAG